MQLKSEANWQRLLQKIDPKDASAFWKQIRQLTGNDIEPVHFIRNRDGVKLEKANEISEEFKSILQEKFDGTDPPGHTFDDLFKEEVRGFLEVPENAQRVSPYDSADPSRHGNGMMQEITIARVFATIKKTRNKAPGSSGIRQIHLKNLPDNMLEQLCKIYNSCLTAGYFPLQFKKAIINMIPKPGKNPTDATNYTGPSPCLRCMEKSSRKS